MSDKQIIIKIDQLGQSSVEAVGFAGVGCKDATKAIEKALGADMSGSSTQLKGDFYQSEEATEEARLTW